MVVTAWVDSVHVANKVTRLSHFGHVIFANRAPIKWLSQRHLATGFPQQAPTKQPHSSPKRRVTIASTIWRTPPDRTDMWVYYFTTYTSSIAYVMNVNHFTKAQIHSSIQKKAIKATLSKCGYCSKTARAIFFGPTWLGGITLRDLYVEQGINNCNWFICHWQHPSQIKHLTILGAKSR